MSRMVGGTFGVAVMGALISTIGHAQIDKRLPHLPAQARAVLANALGSGAASGGPHTNPHVVPVMREAFVSALGTGLLIGSIVTLIGAVLAWRLVQSKQALQPASPSAPETSAVLGDEPQHELSTV
jgi:hypothetical protein